MILLILALALYVVGGLLCLAGGAISRRAAASLGAGSAMAGSLLGLGVALSVLVSGQEIHGSATWNLPFASCTILVDAVSAFFMIPLFLLGFVTALYGSEYVGDSLDGPSTGLHWLLFNTLLTSMALVTVAGNAVLFLVAWEVMSLSSFFLVVTLHHEESVRDAGWKYLVATHLGSACLIVFFLLAATHTGSLELASFADHPWPTALAGLLFILALIGFGTKAGFMPFHVWLPVAHPAAPSHVSALMSGVMIKMGIYGVVRMLLLLGQPPAWWGLVLVAIGAVSGVMGVLLALGQHDVKRLLAFHSVENIGIIALGLGAGVLGISYRIPSLAALGFAGGLLHVLNHAMFKGLLFLGAGSVHHATGTREMDLLGGLSKRMPWTSLSFLIGSVAICGIPPLNGFVSEILIYLGAFSGFGSASQAAFGASVCVFAALALIGGLAAACFTKAFGTIFLGEPRSACAAQAHEAGPAMRSAMLTLVAGCVVVGVGFTFVSRILVMPVAALTGLTPQTSLGAVTPVLTGVCIGATVLLALVLVAAAMRRKALAGKPVDQSGTWDCGYLKPTARMQYTSSSFAQPILEFFGPLLRQRRTEQTGEDAFPHGWRFHSHVPDLLMDRLYVPLFKAFERALSLMRWLQGGKVHVYVMYIALTLVLLLAWNLLWSH